MAPKGRPEMARQMAWRIAAVVKTAVERPRQVASVKGLKRKLVMRAAGEKEAISY